MSKRLEELKQSGFIAEIAVFGKKERDKRYIVIDEYSLFYLTWNADLSSLDLQEKGPGCWLKQRNTPAWRSWTGRAFESLCMKHVEGIKAALGLAAVQTTTSKWRYLANRSSNDTGCEIDLIIDRADNCINLCEMKYSNDEFVINKAYAEKLRKNKECFDRVTNTKKSTCMTLITTYGAKHNEYYLATVDQEVTMDALFMC